MADKDFGIGGVNNHRTYRNYSQKLVYLCGNDKFDTTGQFVSLTLDDIDYFISDAELSDELKRKYINTTFICTK